jgi:hypothetical protein
MKRRRCLFAILVLALPVLACNLGALGAWGDLVATAGAIWSATWAKPEPDYYAISLFCSETLKDTHGDPPQPYVDAIIVTTLEIAAAWGIEPPYSRTLTLGNAYAKPDGSGRVMVPVQFPNPGGAYGVPVGEPLTGLCLEFEEVDVDETPVPLLADGYQVGDWVLPTTTPRIGYAECASGITPTPLATDTPTPAPGDGYEDDDPPHHSSIAVNESQARTLEPTGDVEIVHLWVWNGLHVQVKTHDLGGLASTNVEVATCSGTFGDTDGGQATVEWTSACDEVAIITITSANGFYGPGESYTLSVNQLP